MTEHRRWDEWRRTAYTIGIHAKDFRPLEWLAAVGVKQPSAKPPQKLTAKQLKQKNKANFRAMKAVFVRGGE